MGSTEDFVEELYSNLTDLYETSQQVPDVNTHASTGTICTKGTLGSVSQLQDLSI
jgi:hypothetical protein